VTAPAALEEVVQLLLVLEHPVHVKEVGSVVHRTSSLIDVPATGVALLALMLQLGVEDVVGFEVTDVHSIAIAVASLMPVGPLATSPYVFVPASFDVTEHVSLTLSQPDHT
jgi:hypothetical protein